MCLKFLTNWPGKFLLNLERLDEVGITEATEKARLKNRKMSKNETKSENRRLVYVKAISLYQILIAWKINSTYVLIDDTMI